MSQEPESIALRFSKEQKAQMKDNFLFVKVKDKTLQRLAAYFSNWTNCPDFIVDKTGELDALKSPYLEVAIPRKPLETEDHNLIGFEEWDKRIRKYKEGIGIENIKVVIADPNTYAQVFIDQQANIGKTPITKLQGTNGIRELQWLGGVPTSSVAGNGRRVYFSVHLTDTISGESYHGPHFTTHESVDKFKTALPVIIPTMA